eukprot:gene4113-6402_t
MAGEQEDRPAARQDDDNDAAMRDPEEELYCGDWQAELQKRVADGEEQDAIEDKWGFTAEELEKALKVVGILRYQPEVFLEDAVLKTTGLWRWINRPPNLRNRGKRVHQELVKTVRLQKRRLMREEDKRKIAKTEMRVARDEALERLLTIDPTQQRALLIETEKGAELQVTGERAEEVKLIPAAGTSPAPEDDEASTLFNSRKCHICKEAFKDLHHFYYSLCRSCGEFNYGKRLQTRNLAGKVIILTGARIKIGYQIALRLLKDGATLIATTRFPK